LSLPRIASGAALVVCLGAVAVACLGTSSSSAKKKPKAAPVVKFELPSTSGGCDQAKSVGGATTIPIKVSTVDGQVGVLANICVGEQGPFPFQIDSGSDSVTVTAQLAQKLGLRAVGKPVEIGGAGCSATEQNASLGAWSLAGIPLQAQKVSTAMLPDLGGEGEPQGLVGADVLSRFGAVRIDFAKETLTVVGSEGPAVKKPREIKKPSTKRLPAALITGKAKITAPMTVVMQPGSVTTSVPVTFGGGGEEHEFNPDTGASISIVDQTLGKKLHLKRTGKANQANTACAVVTVPNVRSGPWELAGKKLAPRELGTVDLIKTSPSEGLLGADVMKEYGSVVFDYAGGRFLLGAN
jgi:hypothetical protein